MGRFSRWLIRAEYWWAAHWPLSRGKYFLGRLHNVLYYLHLLKPAWHKCGHAAFLLNARDYPAQQLLIGHSYEAEMQAFFCKHLEPGDVVVDVGANFGFFALLAAQLVGPTGKVICFEPNLAMTNLLALHARVNQLNNIQIEAYALSDSADTRSFYICKFNVGKSSLSPVNAADGEEIQVPVRRLDDMPWLNRVDFIKLDVEGAEAAVLRGSERILHDYKPIVVCELVPGQLAGFGATVQDIVGMFPPHEWRSERIDPLNVAFLPM